MYQTELEPLIGYPDFRMTIADFFNEGIRSQQDYAEAHGTLGPMDRLTPEQSYAKVIDFIGHAQEELMELRTLYPRRFWRNDEKAPLKSEALEEFADILIVLRAVSAFAQFSGEEISRALHAKLEKNRHRTDHQSKSNR